MIPCGENLPLCPDDVPCCGRNGFCANDVATCGRGIQRQYSGPAADAILMKLEKSREESEIQSRSGIRNDFVYEEQPFLPFDTSFSEGFFEENQVQNAPIGSTIQFGQISQTGFGQSGGLGRLFSSTSSTNSTNSINSFGSLTNNDQMEMDVTPSFTFGDNGTIDDASNEGKKNQSFTFGDNGTITDMDMSFEGKKDESFTTCPSIRSFYNGRRNLFPKEIKN